MIQRDLRKTLGKDALKVPILTIIGPRQSGKTTLARSAFPRHAYVSFEDIDKKNFALSDPRGFLQAYHNDFGIILDEVQHVPALLSYIQSMMDLEKRPGYFILTSCQSVSIKRTLTQALAEKISVYTLLPLSLHELYQSGLLSADVDQAMFKGFYPILYAQEYKPTKWYGDYVRTYIERDVRAITNVSSLSTFQRFIQLCSGRIGQLLNLVSLGNDCGISHNTAKAWLAILEASSIVFLLQPNHQHFSKHVIKTPKLFFYDTGLACFLLGIETEQQLKSHYLRAELFESLVIADFYKQFYNADKVPRLSFWRDKASHEVDCLIEQGAQAYPVEIKAGKTVNLDYFDGLTYWNNLAYASPDHGFLVYGGNQNQKRSLGNVVSWEKIFTILEMG